MLVGNYFYLLSVGGVEEATWHNEEFEHNNQTDMDSTSVSSRIQLTEFNNSRIINCMTLRKFASFSINTEDIVFISERIEIPNEVA